ncbi:MAG: hypothetical protein KDM63_14500 [Verrucomicrobiae bacterium]|nr:hypothetical protein [Verrucomicrobiae bacterium]
MNTRDTLSHYVSLTSDQGSTITLMKADRVEEHLRLGILEKDYETLWDIFAASDEEASSIHAMRLGWRPYHPVGEPQLCPGNCGCHYYPLGSGECPLCGPIVDPESQSADQWSREAPN